MIAAEKVFREQVLGSPHLLAIEGIRAARVELDARFGEAFRGRLADRLEEPVVLRPPVLGASPWASPVGLERLRSLHLNDSLVSLGSNRDRHAILGQGELGERGCANFLSEPRFEQLPCVVETGRDSGAPAAEDVAAAFRLRKRGKATRSRAKTSRRRRDR